MRKLWLVIALVGVGGCGQAEEPDATHVACAAMWAQLSDCAYRLTCALATESAFTNACTAPAVAAMAPDLEAKTSTWACSDFQYVYCATGHGFAGCPTYMCR